MTPREPEILIELRLGDRTRTVPVVSLAAVFRIPTETIRSSLEGLLFASTDQDAGEAPDRTREPTEGVGSNETSHSDSFEEGEKESRTRSRGESEGAEHRLPESFDARTIATALDDLPNLAAFEAVLRHHPPERVVRALTVTLSRPSSAIRTTRGAYFTGVLRTLAGDEEAS